MVVGILRLTVLTNFFFLANFLHSAQIPVPRDTVALVANSSLPKPSVSSPAPTKPASSASSPPTKPASPAPHAPPQSSGTCESIRVRKEWRGLSYDEKANYIKSVKCLARLPSKLLGASYRRWDDFEYVHCNMRKRIHSRPLFLPWHRYFIRIYEKVLQEDCNLKGTLPYWNWTLDSQNITRSPMWSSDTTIGFGSNGSFFGPGSDPDDLDAGVVTDGAFAKFPIYYPGRMMLQRNFNLHPPFAIPGYYLGSQWYNPNNMGIIASQTNYTSFIMHLEGNYKQPDGTTLPGPHSIMHTLLGGDMPDLAYSANDPVFYPQHGRVDEVSSKWQRNGSNNRTYEFLPAGGFAANLDDKIDYMDLVPPIKIREVMDTFKPPLCYRYE